MKKKQMTDEELRVKIKKLPLWMQKVANEALSARDEARVQMDQLAGAQKPTPFFAEDYDHTQSFKKVRRYFEAKDTMIVQHNGIHLEISIYANNCRDGKGIALSYSEGDDLGSTGRNIAILPMCSGQIELRRASDMRGFGS